jgi:hypothetical protein
MFTTLPTPELDYIYGGQGNDASCTAQAFFIQIGTIAGYMNVSLAFYYLLQIKYGWNERRLKSLRGWFFAVPTCIGLAFAFAGETTHVLISLPSDLSAEYSSFQAYPITVTSGSGAIIWQSIGPNSL